MCVTARPQHIDVHYRTFHRRLRVRGAPAVSHGLRRGIRSALDAIIRGMPQPQTHTRPIVMAVWLVVAGVIGWWAAFSLTMERLHLLADPEALASCDFNFLVQCKANLDSWQGSVFGFPNPILGLTGWVAPIVVGMAILARARFARWFWWLFAAGVTLAFGFVIWLISQSIFVLGTLCPWCMVTWVVTIPTFYIVVLHLLRAGIAPVPATVRRAADALMSWVPLMAVASYAVIAIIAQARLDVLGVLF
jgi:uncharacterized membrane protein